MPESATEWMASASIDEAPVSRNARNFVTAIPVLARSAATTALVLPSVDMRGRLPVTAGAAQSLTRPSRRYSAAYRPLSTSEA